MKFSKVLVHWYLRNKRDLPWRKINNPYYVWLSEIILQQTRVDQGMEYYLKFITHFPTINDLALASEEQVLKQWQGLGYYSRARNLHFSANYIVDELQGDFPTSYNELIKLKGVGDYTASAVASICFNEPTAVVDGNVYRVLARYFGIETPINKALGIKEFKKLAQALLDPAIPGTHNQAIMEFGARMCKPQKPNCELCPLSSGCLAIAHNKVNKLPVKEKKLKVKKRYFNYLVVQTPLNRTRLKQREKGIWMNLYEFPLIESLHEIQEGELIQDPIFDQLFKSQSVVVSLFNKEILIHKLTHQHIYTKFWVVNTQDSPEFDIAWNEIYSFPVSTLVHNFLIQFKTD